MSDELKPCPLCGGPVLVHRRTDGQVDGIVCDECLLTLEAVDVYPEWHTLDELVLRWNARAAVTDEQFAMAVHDGGAWQVVRTCHMSMCDEDDDDLPAYYRSYKCDACGKTHARYKGDDYDYCPRCGAKVTDEEEVG